MQALKVLGALFLVPLAFYVGAVLGAYSLRHWRPTPAPEVPVMVAARDIQRGEALDASLLREELLDKSIVVSVMILPGEAKAYFGREILIDLPYGAPIYKTALKPLATGVSQAELLMSNGRAGAAWR